MRFTPNTPPREFNPLDDIRLKDCGLLELDTDEQITLQAQSGRRNDIVRKEWGYYLGNSINFNLKGQGFRLALVASYASQPPRMYLNLVEADLMDKFDAYCRKHRARVITWLDDWLAELPPEQKQD